MSNGIHPGEFILSSANATARSAAQICMCSKRSMAACLAGWLYELNTIAVSVLFAQEGRWEPESRTMASAFSDEFKTISHLGHSRVRSPGREGCGWATTRQPPTSCLVGRRAPQARGRNELKRRERKRRRQQSFTIASVIAWPVNQGCPFLLRFLLAAYEY